MVEKFCMKRNENFIVGKTSEDYCVDCKYFDNGDCWASNLPIKYTENEPVYIERKSTKILNFPKTKNN